MSSIAPTPSENNPSRERRRNRIRAPFGDEDIPIVFAGAVSHELFHRRLASSRGTAFIYDEQMLQHENMWYPSYAERPERATAIFDRCTDYGLLDRCLLISAEPAQEETLSSVHDAAYIDQISGSATMSDEQRKALASNLDSVYFNDHTNLAARIAAGCVIQGVDSVHRGDVRNAFCLVRPPGHHAMIDEACGFCIFNNVAIAARYALNKLDYNRILILDWDVHHGNGTQYAFYNDPRVLFISIHRYDNQSFWPSLRESNYDFIGSGRGQGFNINIPWNDGGIGDADYLAVFHQIILPIAFEFDPDLVLISAGYDCAYGCPLGQLNVSPPLFAHLTHKLMCLAEGKVVITLEGGYYCDSLAESAAHTVSALLGDPVPSLDKLTGVRPSVLKTISDCVSALRSRWKSLHVFQAVELIPEPDVSDLPERSWEASSPGRIQLCDIKVPTIEPEPHINPPESLEKIEEKMRYFKKKHPVGRNAQSIRTCAVYDSRMENHKNEDNRDHPESSQRIRRAFDLMEEYGLASRCKRVEARHATEFELLRVHDKAYVDKIADTAEQDQQTLNELGNEESSVYFNKHTYDSARIAAGSVLAIVDEVCTGQSTNGIAIIRPPGHHALPDQCMGFCIFNNVAIGVRHAQARYGLERVAIVDWDVHHGNGTRKIFEDDPNVLYISIHRYDDGRFFPSAEQSSHAECGTEDGIGRTVHVAWNGRHAKDGDYIAAFTHLILPILYEFRAQLTFVSAGFDAARGDRIGGLGVSLECFAHLTHLLMTVSHLVSPVETTREQSSETLLLPQMNGQSSQQQQQSTFAGGLILVLEGGYTLATTAEALCQSVASLLGDCCPRLLYGLCPTDKGSKAIRRALAVQERYWQLIHGYGPIREQVGHDPLLQLSTVGRRVGSHSALAFTGQMESDCRPPPDDLSLSEGASPIFRSLVTQPAPSAFTSLSLGVSDVVGMGSPSTSLATTSIATHGPNSDLGTCHHPATDPSTMHLTATGAQVASSIILPSSSGYVQQTAEDLTHVRITSPNTGQSDGSSLASDTVTVVQGQGQPPGHLTTGAAGASAISDQSSAIDSAGNRMMAFATLHDLMSYANIGTEDIHAFFGLPSAQQLPQRLFAITPLSWCPHLVSVGNNSDWNPDIHESCCRCENREENWACLTCYTVACSRYANSHMLEHFNSTRHPIVLSFSDISTWCYECQSYVHNEVLESAKRAAHRAKFGVDPPES
ncbi:unnamed protein product [Calicophoron daubneyi]|uniref:Protein deacetylase HDAC6 n=1 Tax=Calicophoron daubneyi TaxID=300641 RepID=A0AAV2TP75_CALDB